jgi:hypothetical protein
VAALIEDARQEVNTPPPDKLTQALYGDAARPDGINPGSNFSSTGEAIANRMPKLMKGAGFVGEGNNTPLTDQTDILRRASQATLDLRMATREGYSSKSSVVKSMSPDFLGQFGALRTALSTPSIQEQLTSFLGTVASPDLARSFTAGNLGIGSSYGLTPFNLLAPSRLIYPVCPF